MIRIARIDLDETLGDRLVYRTERLTRRAANAKSARGSWKNAVNERTGIKDALSNMASGIERCMYCGDSRGTDIDHFEPINAAPLRAFDWLNHLLACSSCNSNAKRDGFPCDEGGDSLLVNPTVEDPSDHLELRLSEGRYAGRTPKGWTTIHTFQLNRVDLSIGRAIAFARCKSMLRDYLNLEAAGRVEEAAVTRLALERQPFADVLHAMRNAAHSPGAAIVLGGTDVLKVLSSWQETI